MTAADGEWPPPDILRAAGRREWYAGLAQWELDKRPFGPHDLLSLEGCAQQADIIVDRAAMLERDGHFDDKGKQSGALVAYDGAKTQLRQMRRALMLTLAVRKTRAAKLDTTDNRPKTSTQAALDELTASKPH